MDSVPQAVRTDNFLSTIHTGFISRIGSVLEQLKKLIFRAHFLVLTHQNFRHIVP